jgi:tripartite-type tricarboxylate transporter receptor subunit TctC
MAVVAVLTLLPGYAQTDYPTKNIRIIVPYGPGGINDFAARGVSTRLADALGQSVVVDNRPGAAGIVGTKLSAMAPADGYTFSVGSVGTHAINMSLYKDLPYNVLRDFTPITDIVVAQNLVVVHPSLPVQSVKELIALAKSRPAEINYGSAGSGSTTHLSAELFKVMTGVNMVHVPYKGGGASIVGVLSGEVSVVFASMPSAMNLAKTGRLRPLAVTGSKRSPSLPELPTVAEAGVPGYEFNGWVGLFAPAGTSPLIVSRLYTETLKVLRLPKTKQVFFNQGVEIGGMPPDEFSAFVKAEIAKWEKVVKLSGARVD